MICPPRCPTGGGLDTRCRDPVPQDRVRYTWLDPSPSPDPDNPVDGSGYPWLRLSPHRGVVTFKTRQTLETSESYFVNDLCPVIYTTSVHTSTTVHRRRFTFIRRRIHQPQVLVRVPCRVTVSRGLVVSVGFVWEVWPSRRLV